MFNRKTYPTIDKKMNQVVNWVWRKSFDYYHDFYVKKPLAVSEQYLTMADSNRGDASFCVWMAHLGAIVDNDDSPVTSTLVVSSRGCLLVGDWKDAVHRRIEGGGEVVVTAEEQAKVAERAVVAFHDRPGAAIHNRLHEPYETPQWVIVMSCDGLKVYLDWLADGVLTSDEDRLKCYQEALRVLRLVDIETPLIADLQTRIDEVASIS